MPTLQEMGSTVRGDSELMLLVGGADIVRDGDTVRDREAGRGAAAWAEALRGRYGLWETDFAGSYLSAIAVASKRRPRAVLAALDETIAQPSEAIAGLRLAAGTDARVVVCCAPEFEPLARRTLSSGADEYLLTPLREKEVDAAIGYPRPAKSELSRLVSPPTASMEELEHVTGLFEAVELRPREMLDRLAALTRIALSSRGATVIVEGAIATSGDVVTKPVLMSAVEGSRGVVGQLTVSERISGAYTPGDAEKLRRYAVMASRALSLGSSYRLLRELSVTDEATGLPNRRHLSDRLEAILRQAQRDRFPVTVLLFGIDGMRSANDLRGCETGDHVLSAIGASLRKHCREQDVVARLGSDAIGVVFWDARGARTPGSQPLDGAMVVLERIRADLEKEGPHSGPYGTEATGRPEEVDVRLTISGGLATYPWDATTSKELIERADLALLEATRAGKNCVIPIRTGRG